MKIYIFIIIVLISASNLMAIPNDSLIYKANKEYSEGLYNDAIENYLKVIDNGYESSELYYNIGNSYFKINDMASAILYFEKAKKLSPNNEDIIFNLNVANSKIVDKIETVPELFYIRWWNTFYKLFSVDTWAKITIFIFILTLIFASIFFLSSTKKLKKFSFWIGIILLLLTIFTFGLSSQKYYYSKKYNEAIVFTPTLTVKSSPNKNSVDLFVIHEGAKVLIIDNVDNWYEIRIANGSVGWMPCSAVKRI